MPTSSDPTPQHGSLSSKRALPLSNLMAGIERVLTQWLTPLTWLSLIGLFLITAAVAIQSGDALRYPDEHDYQALAKHLIAGEGYLDEAGAPTAYRPPGYPFFLSVVFRISERPLFAKLLNALAYALSAGLICLLVGRVNRLGRLFVAPLFVLYPIGLYTASTLYPQTLGTLLLLIVISLILGRKTHLRIGLAGLCFGALVLVVPAWLLLAPLIGLILFFQTPSQHRIGLVDRLKQGLLWQRGLVFGILMLAVLAPWAMRNARVFNAFIPVSTNSGLNLLLGNSENTTANSGVNVDIRRYDRQVTELNDAEKDKKLRGFAMDWISDNRGAAAKLYGAKALNYFNFRNKLYVQAEASKAKDAIMFISYYFLLGLALIRLSLGLLKKLTLSPVERSLYLIYIGNAFVAAIFFTRLRFRVPFDALLIGIVAIFLGVILQAWASRVTPVCDESSEA